MLPEWASGFWQSKLRYRDQDELLEVAREYKRRDLPLSVIVCDYFHWTRQGEWKFDPAEWPDPQAMLDELRELGVELVVSVWPTVNPNSDNYTEMDRRGLLVRNVAGLPLHMAFWDKGTEGQAFMRFYDATNPAARRYVWEKITDGYRGYGIRAFWLDACEPEISLTTPRTPGTSWARAPRYRGSIRGSMPGASTRGCGRAAKTTCCSFAGPPGRAASATGPPCGRATSSPRSRRSPHKSRPA
jgi:alpha-glucosidase (family GH31 glycosyl hydrolase)